MPTLWLLRPVEDLTFQKNPWRPWYDRCFGFVIVAEDDDAARRLADENAGQENDYGQHPWLDPRYSTCTALTPDGSSPSVIIKDYHAA